MKTTYGILTATVLLLLLGGCGDQAPPASDHADLDHANEHQDHSDHTDHSDEGHAEHHEGDGHAH